MILEQGNLPRDEQRFLKGSFHGFRALVKKTGKLPLHLDRVLWCTLQVEFAFLLAVAAWVVPIQPVSVVLAAATICFLAALAAPVILLVAGLFVGKLHKRIYRRSMIYWSWWHCWAFALCCVSAIMGAFWGRYLWYTSLHAYYGIASLQTYRGINPQLVPGERLQDAGLVEFTDGVGVDRSKGGCFVNVGRTYCVAPIVHGGRLHEGMADMPVFGAYDYFAVGIDCCNCPNQDFRCGDWKNPLANGGLRSVDYWSRPFYKMAVEDFSAAWLKGSKHPLFFDWVEDSMYQWKQMWYWTCHVLVLTALVPVPVAFVIGALAALLLQHLQHQGAASPFDTPRPPAGLERAWAVLLPEMLRQHHEERQQLLALPASAMPWYAATGCQGEFAPPAP